MLTSPGVPLDDIIGYVADRDLIALKNTGDEMISSEINRVSDLLVKNHPEFPHLRSLADLHQTVLAAVNNHLDNIILNELTPLSIIAIDLARSGQLIALATLLSDYLNKSSLSIVSPECYKLTCLQQEHILSSAFKAAFSHNHSFTCAQLFMYMTIMQIHPTFLERYFAQITGRGWIDAIKWMVKTFSCGNPDNVPVQLVDYAIEHNIALLNWLYDGGCFIHEPITTFFLRLDEIKLHQDIRAGDIELLKWFVDKIGGPQQFSREALFKAIAQDYIIVAQRYRRENILKYLTTLV